MQKLKYSLVVVASFFLTACNITKVPLAYCPASTHGAYTSHTLKVGKVYDDRINEGNLTNDPREIGEFSWKQSIAPSIYYGVQPITNTVQTTLHMSLEQAGYKLTSVHPDRVLFSRIEKVDLHLEGKNNRQRILYCGIKVNFAMTDSREKVLWRQTIIGEGTSIVPASTDHNELNGHVKNAVNCALDDLVLQLERSPGFNKVLR
jgi:hypothetical protein